MEKQTSKIHRWRRESVEKRLLEVAEELIMTRGPDQVPLALVARAAGVSRATAYNYFNDQRGLLTKFVSHRFQELHKALDTVLQQYAQEPRLQLRALIREAVNFFERYSKFFRILVRERADVVMGGRRDGLTEEINRGLEEYAKRLVPPLRAGMRQGLFVGQEPERMAWAIAGMVTHAVLRILQNPTVATRTSEVEIMEEIIFHAVLTEPSSTTRRLIRQPYRAVVSVEQPGPSREPATASRRVKSALCIAALSLGMVGCATKHARVASADLPARVEAVERRVSVIETRQEELENKAWDVAYLKGRVEGNPSQPHMEQYVLTSPGDGTRMAPSDAHLIQLALRRAGFYDGPIDGKVGPRTKKAIKAFQKARGLKADGKVGPKTWKALKRYAESSGLPEE